MNTISIQDCADELAHYFVDRVIERFADRPGLLNSIYTTLSATVLEDPTEPLTDADEAPEGAMKVRAFLYIYISIIIHN